MKRSRIPWAQSLQMIRFSPAANFASTAFRR
jgi:hypothetical protein